MERFRIKNTILSGMPNSLVLDIARNMVKEASIRGFAPSELTFYMGDIAYDKLTTHMELTVTREIECKKLFGIEIKRLSSITNDPETLILEGNVPLLRINYSDGRTLRSAAYDEQPFIRSLKHMIENVIFNDPATIILWKDGTKTIVQAQGEDFDPEKGMAMAIAKKALGNQGNYYDIFKEWLPEEGEEFYNPFEGFSHIFKMGDCEIENNPKEIKKGNKDED